jgi:hypothetical protein
VGVLFRAHSRFFFSFRVIEIENPFMTPSLQSAYFACFLLLFSVSVSLKSNQGVWLQVSLATLVPIGALVMLSWFATGTLLEAYPFNVKAQTANRAEYYAAVLAIAIPARIGLSQLTQFYQVG